MKEHNILLYVENLNAKVCGHFEYKIAGDKSNEVHKIEIKEFYLDLLKGQCLIKNHTFKDFWQNVEDVQNQLANNVNLTVQ